MVDDVLLCTVADLLGVPEWDLLVEEMLIVMVMVDIFNIAKIFKRPLRNVIAVYCMGYNAKLGL